MRIARALVGWSVAIVIIASGGLGTIPPASADRAKGLSLDEIRGVMRANARAFNACLTAASRPNKPLHGPFLYQIEVDHRGKVTSAHPYAPSTAAAFDKCVVGVIKRAKFPGGPAHVEAPLVFDAD